MRSLGSSFCAVCAQSYVLRLYRGGWGTPAAGIDTIEPGTESPAPGTVVVPALLPHTFSVGLLTPTLGALNVTWLVNGVAQSSGVTTSSTATSFVLTPSPGIYTVLLQVRDTTTLVNAAMAGTSLQRSRIWTMDARASADLGVQLTASRVSVLAGQPLTFALTVTNAGPSAATGATVQATWPTPMPAMAWTCLASVGASCPSSGGGALSHSVTIPSGGTLTYSASGTVPATAATSLTATATVAPPSGVLDPVTGNNAAQVSVSVTARTGYHTVAPCRIADTRAAEAPALAAGSTRIFAVTGRCGVPSSANAVSVNLTVTQPTGPGNLRLFASDAPAPVVSAINWSANQTRGNNAVVRLGPSGNVSVLDSQTSGSVHFILDVNGYFE